jgi:hypothetical protein
MNFTLEDLEGEIARREHEPAGRKLLEVLTAIDTHHGALGGLSMAFVPSGLNADELARTVACRLAGAIGTLFADPGFQLSDEGFYSFITRQRWITTIFAATPLHNADHVIRALSGTQADGIHLNLDHPALLKLCVLYTTESQLALNCDLLWFRSPRVCAALLMALLSPRLTISPVAHAKRELVLGWLPRHLDQLQTSAVLPEAFLHDVWMHCSYAMREDKHAVKSPLNRLVRRRLTQMGIEDVLTPYAPPAALPEKPTLMVVLEWFHSTHSIYRTHSLSMLSLKERYRLVGVGMKECTDDTTRAMFDEFIELSNSTGFLDNVALTRQAAERLRPQVVYYPSLGMFPYTIYTCNLRLAPVQIAALGHPATTYSAMMDYVVVEEDYVGDPACFCERLIVVPRDAIPYRPPAVWPERYTPGPRHNDSVRVAVIGASMKLNAEFLETCRKISAQAKSRVEFHFIPAFAIGLSWICARDEINRVLPTAVVHKMMPFAEYLECIANCDMFVNPFPFGNTNTIVDTISQGLPGVNRAHREVHSNIDRGLFRRLGLPEELSSTSEQAMIDVAVKMIDDPAWRAQLSAEITRNGLAEPLFRGEESHFCDHIVKTHQEHPMRLVNEPAKPLP